MFAPRHKDAGQMRRFLKPDATDENWEYFGRECPYFGVVSWPKFRLGMDAEARAEFFLTGEVYLERLFGEIERTFQTPLQPNRSLDFGCGVGRLLIPLGRRSGSVTGVDVSPSMIAEAQKNCRELGVKNASFVRDPEDLLASGARFDFVNSFIVFQHIRPDRGVPLFAKLVELLAQNGVGAIHLTFSSPAGKRDRLTHWLYRKVPVLYGLVQMRRGGKFSEPLMDMAEYPLERIFAILQDAGCHDCHVRFTRHGVRGLTLLFRKKALDEI